MKKIIAFLFIFLLISVTDLTATPFYADEIIYEVSGDQMDGMLISIEFDDQGEGAVNAIWKSNGVNSGGVSGDDWSLTFVGADTWSAEYYWKLYSEHVIRKLTINALAGSTVFDIIYSQVDWPSTAGSECGWWEANDLTGSNSSGVSIISGQTVGWNFIDDVALSNTWPNGGLGDLYGTLVLTFLSPIAFPENNMFKFQLDTDHAVVPEPTTFILLGTGVISIIGACSKRKTKL